MSAGYNTFIIILKNPEFYTLEHKHSTLVCVPGERIARHRHQEARKGTIQNYNIIVVLQIKGVEIFTKYLCRWEMY